uniref:Zinc finger LSD1-type domain-containing protein n=1 Tax=Ananas comosus var. bracteatus TaxID=296719 RepID=A0A6V7P9F7_ANACO|nr:unnamed protein product [Ananas comosus var. bracteatus]
MLSILKTIVVAEFQQRPSAFWLVCDVGRSDCCETWFGAVVVFELKLLCYCTWVISADLDRISRGSDRRRASVECLDYSGLWGAVGVDGGLGLLFLHQIVPRARVFGLLDLFDHVYLIIACESLIELDRDTLAYSCGGSCIVSTGGTGVLTVPGMEPSVAAAALADSDRGKSVATQGAAVACDRDDGELPGDVPSPGFEILDPSPPPPPPPKLPSPPKPPPPPPLPEMGQMVCGSCRELVSYPKGAVHVQCACCRAVNFVLEGSIINVSHSEVASSSSSPSSAAHQVGNVKCGKCSLLLMYPYGAPAVRCSSCYHVTEIGVILMNPCATATSDCIVNGSFS